MKRCFALVIILAAGALALCGCSQSEPDRLTHYSIRATLSQDKTLVCSTTCEYVNNTDVPLSEVWFHLYPAAFRRGAKLSPVPADRVQDAFPAGKSYATFKICSVKVNGSEVEVAPSGEDEDILAVPLGFSLEPKDSVRISVDSELALPNVKHRLGYTEHSVNLGNFYPIACVYRGGAFVADPYYSTGDPFFSECADYDVEITVPSAYTGAFTGSATANSNGENTVYSIKAHSVRDFAAVVGEYQRLSGSCDGTTVHYLYYNDSDPEGALNAAIDSLRIFGEMFGKYPYPEYSVVQTGFLQGGMEYPCMSMISDEYTMDAKRDIIVHETAHQWWYGLVGNDQVRYPWLDEALAEYSTMLFYERAQGYKYTMDAKRADALAAYTLYCEAYKNNGMGNTSMTRAVNEYDSETEYTYMTYVKGALMLDDVRNTIGNAAFVSGLRSYASQNRYGIAEPQHLIGALERSSGKNVGAIIEPWLKGDVKLFSTN